MSYATITEMTSETQTLPTTADLKRVRREARCKADCRCRCRTIYQGAAFTHAGVTIERGDFLCTGCVDAWQRVAARKPA